MTPKSIKSTFENILFEMSKRKIPTDWYNMYPYVFYSKAKLKKIKKIRILEGISHDAIIENIEKNYGREINVLGEKIETRKDKKKRKTSKKEKKANEDKDKDKEDKEMQDVPRKQRMKEMKMAGQPFTYISHLEKKLEESWKKLEEKDKTLVITRENLRQARYLVRCI